MTCHQTNSENIGDNSIRLVATSMPLEAVREWHAALDDVWCAMGEAMPEVLQDAYVEADKALDDALRAAEAGRVIALG